jgi:hypothetical protein
VLLRMLREPRTGRPAPLTRLLAVLLAGALIGISAPVLLPMLAWVIGLL